MIEAQLPDGTILEFPDGTAQDVIQSTAKKMLATIPAIPDPIVPELAPEGSKPLARSLEDIVPRSVFTGAGGIFGSGVGLVGGAPTGPGAIGTSLAGGALGASGGSALFDNLDNAMKAFGFFDNPREPKDALAVAQKAVQEGAIDLAFGAAGATIKPVFNILRGGKPIMSRLLGISNERAASLAQAGLREGIDIGIADVSKRGIVKGFEKVAGVFPFIGAPGRRAAKAAAPQTEKAFENLLGDIAPTGLMSDLGIETQALARGEFKAVRGIADMLYGRFRALARVSEVQDIVPRKRPRVRPRKSLPKSHRKALKPPPGRQGPN